MGVFHCDAFFLLVAKMEIKLQGKKIIKKIFMLIFYCNFVIYLQRRSQEII